VRRVLWTALVAALVGGVIGGLSLATASTSRDRHVRTFTFTEITRGQQFVDVGKKGFSLGDEFFFRSTFHKNGKLVGRNQTFCVISGRGSAQCEGTAWFMGGTLRFSGLVPTEARDFVAPIVGGTGRWRGVDGQVRVHSLSQTRSRDVLELVIPS
jgi:hypothetical protein